MSPTRGAAHLALIEDAQASPAVEELFAGARRIWAGEVATLHRVLALDPELYRRHSELMWATLAGPKSNLTFAERVQLGLAIARLRQCPATEDILLFMARRGPQRGQGLSPEQVQAVHFDYRQVRGSERLKELIRFARRLAENPRAVTEDDRARLQLVGINDPEILAIISIVAFFCYTVMLSQGLGVQSNLGAARRDELLGGPWAAAPEGALEPPLMTPPEGR